jgi:hypothetical protein
MILSMMFFLLLIDSIIFLMNELAPDRNVRSRVGFDNFKKPLTAAEYRVVKKFWASTPEDSFTLTEYFTIAE